MKKVETEIQANRRQLETFDRYDLQTQKRIFKQKAQNYRTFLSSLLVCIGTFELEPSMNSTYRGEIQSKSHIFFHKFCYFLNLESNISAMTGKTSDPTINIYAMIG